MAPISTRSIPRQAIRIETLSESQMRVINLHSRMTFRIGDGGELLPPGQFYYCDQFARVLLPERRSVQIQVIEEAAPNEVSSMLDSGNNIFRTIGLNQSVPSGAAPAKLRRILDGDHGEIRGRAAVDLVRSALEVVRQAAGSDGFFDAACTAAADMIDLDRVMILLYENGSWRPRAMKVMEYGTATDSSSVKFSEGLIARVLRTGKTVIYDPNNYNHSVDSSLMQLERAVASPILDETNQLIGVLYGDRELGSTADGGTIGELEAALLEVLAGAVLRGSRGNAKSNVGLR